MNSILENDVREFSVSFELTENLRNAFFLITGATGLIGSTVVRCLLALDCGINITIPVRNKEKATNLFGDNQYLTIISCDLVTYLSNLEDKFTHIIHCASPTSGVYMTRFPVETFTLPFDSTRYILEYVRRQSNVSFVFISSIEYYGQISEDCMLSEGKQGYIDPSSPRSSYPMGKRTAEYLCKAYFNEYDIDVKVARLTQTFGAGVSPDDNRVFAQFTRSIINSSDIVLHTTGESAKPYCYTIDCVSAILYILLRGRKGDVYNVANPDTYISIKDLAFYLRETFAPHLKVIIEDHPEMGYAPVTKLNISVDKLKNLGWQPRVGLKDMFSRLINSLS